MSTPEPAELDRLEQLFDKAFGLTPLARERFLNSLFAEDAALASRLRRMLDDSGVHSLPRAETRGAKPIPSIALGDGAVMGQFTIRRAIGQGGMGVVYEAEQDRPKRMVALKLVRPGLATPALLRRFEFELQVLARLEHPGIARIYEAGTADTGHGPQPYFAMELIRGDNLTDYAERQKLTIRQRLELLARVADAVQYAHQQGVIHRDLKPANILVCDEGAGQPVHMPPAAARRPSASDSLHDFAASPKILDFGVARTTDRDLQTATPQTKVGQIIGTLAYMSPEQAMGDPNQVDTRSDVYSLGVILFELLSGTSPYEIGGRSLPEVARVIAEQPPTQLASLNRSLRGDIETIVAKALAKHPVQRYKSAGELADDVRRHLRHEPIMARPTSVWYQLRQFSRRHKALVGGAAATIIVIVAGFFSTALALSRAIAAEQDQTVQRNRAEASLIQEAAQRKRAQDSEALARKVADFQSRMFSQISVQAFAGQMRSSLQGAVDSAKTNGAAQPSQEERAFQAVLGRMNLLDVSRALLDDNILAPAVRTVDVEMADDPLVRATLLQTIANTYVELGLYGRAQAPQVEAVRLRRNALGEEDPSTLDSIESLGDLLARSGLVSDAPGSLEFASLRDLSQDLCALFNRGISIGGAESYCRMILATRQRVQGERHAKTLATQCSLGFLLSSKGQYEAAEACLREVLSKFDSSDRASIVVAQSARLILADALSNRAQFIEAEALFRAALEVYDRLLGPNSGATIDALYRLGVVLWREGRTMTEARFVLQEALARGRSALGRDHPSTRRSLATYARFVSNDGDLAEAEILYCELLGSYRRAFGNNDPQALMTLRYLSGILEARGNIEGALARTREQLELCRHAPTSTYREYFPMTVCQLATLLHQVGRTSEAYELVVHEIGAFQKEVTDPSECREALGGYADAMFRYLGMFDVAAYYYGERVRLGRQVVGDQIQLGHDLFDLGFVLRRLGRFAEAEMILTECVALRTATAPEWWGLAHARCALADAIAGQRRFAEAEACFVDAAGRVLPAQFGCPRDVKREVLDIAAALYQAWHAAEPLAGHNDQAAEWRAKLTEWQASTQPAVAPATLITP